MPRRHLDAPRLGMLWTDRMYCFFTQLITFHRTESHKLTNNVANFDNLLLHCEHTTSSLSIAYNHNLIYAMIIALYWFATCHIRERLECPIFPMLRKYAARTSNPFSAESSVRARARLPVGGGLPNLQ